MAGLTPSPPARSSVYDHDFDPALAAKLTIRLDGVEQRLVVAYDVQESWIDRYVADAAGHPQLDPDRPGEVWKERAVGHVTVEWRT